MQKILITGISTINKLALAKQIVQLDDDLSIAPIFTTDKSLKNMGVNENYNYYMDTLTVNLSYKNNSLFYVTTNDEGSIGVTFDDYYNNDIFVLSIEELNTIPPKVLEKDDVIIIWLDTKHHKNLTQSELSEVRYFQELIEKIPYMYFLDEKNEVICDTVLNYVNAETNEEKTQILFENN